MLPGETQIQKHLFTVKKFATLKKYSIGRFNSDFKTYLMYWWIKQLYTCTYLWNHCNSLISFGWSCTHLSFFFFTKGTTSFWTSERLKRTAEHLWLKHLTVWLLVIHLNHNKDAEHISVYIIFLDTHCTISLYTSLGFSLVQGFKI